MTKVSIGIVTYNNAAIIRNLLDSIYRHTKGVSFEVYVIDNHSSDDTVKIVKENYPQVILKALEDNLGFGAGHNQVLPILDSEYHAIVNPDIRLTSDAISELTGYLDEHPETVMITPKILNEDGTEQHLPKKKPQIRYLLAGKLGAKSKYFEKLRDEYTLKNQVIDKEIEVDFSTGCFTMLRSEVFKKLGGFDDRFFMYLEDADLTLRAKAYGKAIFYPFTSVVHAWERASAKKIKFLLIHINSMRKFLRKWK